MTLYIFQNFKIIFSISFSHLMIPWADYYVKGSYDAILKIITLCIWCNRICCHALMFKKHIFQILYIIVGPLCPASLKCFVLYKAPPSDKHKSALIGQLTRCIVISRTPQARNAPFHFVSFSFQSKYKDS